MEPASNALVHQLEKMDINQPLAVRALQPLPVVHLDQDQLVKELYAHILPAFQPHIADKGALARVRSLHPQIYHCKQPPELFTQAEAEAVCAVVAKSLATPINPDNYVVSRKVSQLDWKVILPAGEKAFLLLPKKKLFPDDDGATKLARVALVCRQEQAAWKVTRLFSLTALKGKYSLFLSARAIENTLIEAVGRDMFPVCYYDFENRNKPNSSPVRSCYYESLISLYYLEKNGDMDLIQKLAVSAAQKVAYLHERDITLRDLKPHNMLVKNGTEVMLCDMDTVEFGRLQRVGVHIGTHDYFAPELYKGPDSKMCDVFAFGCLLLDLGFNLGPPWDNVPKRKVDDETLHAYSVAADRARACIEASTTEPSFYTIYSQIQWGLRKNPIQITPPSFKKMMFWLAQWALHPDPASRPTMETMYTYLCKSYASVNDLSREEINAFMDIEKRR